MSELHLESDEIEVALSSLPPLVIELPAAAVLTPVVDALDPPRPIESDRWTIGVSRTEPGGCLKESIDFGRTIRRNVDRHVKTIDPWLPWIFLRL
jgi:hypothetical protein